jgi:hypothetical protein
MVSVPALDSITGRTYREDGKPVRVLVRWSSERAARGMASRLLCCRARMASLTRIAVRTTC